MGSFQGLAAFCLMLSLAGWSLPCVSAELRFVSVLFRHGDRTPDNNGFEMYPKDPYLNYNFYPTGLGQLTIKGKNREYKLGEVLRERYAVYLGKVLTPETIECLSSDYDRTKMSLQLVLAGLLPPAPIQEWNQKLHWQPIPAKYLRRIEDNLFLPDECPLFLAEYNKIVDGPEGQALLAPYADLMDHLTNVTGKDIRKPLDLYYMYHTLMSEYSLDLPLPDWAYEIFPQGKLLDAAIASYKIANYNTRLRRLYGGPYLRIITEKLAALRQGTMQDQKKMYLYSGHESNVAAVLNSLGVYQPHVPEYSSAVIIEMHYLNNTFYVKVLYYFGIPPAVSEMKMPGCDLLCPLDKFLELTSDVIPSDDELFCDKTLTQDYASYRPSLQTESIVYNLIRLARDARGR